MKSFFLSIDWMFVLQFIIFLVTVKFLIYFFKFGMKFGFPVPVKKRSVFNTSNFLEQQIVIETLVYKVGLSIAIAVLILGGVSIFLTVAYGFSEAIKLSGVKNSWIFTILFICIFVCFSFGFSWLFNQTQDPKRMTDYYKLKRYLSLREFLNVSLQFRFANLESAFLPTANLSGIDFTGTNFSCADLRLANLSFAKLNDVDMRAIDLREANLREANFENAKMSLSFLNGSILIKSVLINVDLCEADLSGADLSEADLSNADLRKANLFKANLKNANISGANFIGADLTNCDLTEAIGIELIKI